jgi:hypothetical protein
MKSITQRFIQEVKRHEKREWRDKAWHDFASTKAYIAVIVALLDKDPCDSLYDLKVKAEKVLEATKYQ